MSLRIQLTRVSLPSYMPMVLLKLLMNYSILLYPVSASTLTLSWTSPVYNAVLNLRVGSPIVYATLPIFLSLLTCPVTQYSMLSLSISLPTCMHFSETSAFPSSIAVYATRVKASFSLSSLAASKAMGRFPLASARESRELKSLSKKSAISEWPWSFR